MHRCYHNIGFPEVRFVFHESEGKRLYFVTQGIFFNLVLAQDIIGI